MGGGGGGGFFGKLVDPAERAKRVREAEALAQDQDFETEVSSTINSLLADLSNRDTDAINTHLSEIKAALDSDIDGMIDLLFGGSVQKHTYVDGLSDVDALVELNDSELKDKSPDDVKAYFVARLKRRFPDTEITKGRLAVTLEFSDIAIQLLPAVRERSGWKIPDANGTGWARIKPKEFTDSLSKANRDTGGKVVPAVKLAKSIISSLPENRRLTGYHVEALAVAVFDQYDGPKTPKAMLKHFFKEAPSRILRPIQDATGQSLHVDDYLGAADSTQRISAATAVGRIGTRMENADLDHSTELWNAILDIPPA